MNKCNYDSTLSKAYDETGAETTDYKKMQLKVNEVFEMSQKMLELDYFGK